jgi:hypothetical protein
VAAVTAEIWFELGTGQDPRWKNDEFETSHRLSRWPGVVSSGA